MKQAVFFLAPIAIVITLAIIAITLIPSTC